MSLTFHSKPVLIPGTLKGYTYTEEKIRKMKLPDQVPLVKDFNPTDVYGYVKNFRFSHAIKGIIADFVLVKNMPYAGYGAEIEVSKLSKKKPNEPKEFNIHLISFVKRPVSVKFMLRRIKQLKR